VTTALDCPRASNKILSSLLYRGDLSPHRIADRGAGRNKPMGKALQPRTVSALGGQGYIATVSAITPPARALGHGVTEQSAKLQVT